MQSRIRRDLEGNWKHDRFTGRAPALQNTQKPVSQSMFNSRDD